MPVDHAQPADRRSAQIVRSPPLGDAKLVIVDEGGDLASGNTEAIFGEKL